VDLKDMQTLDLGLKEIARRISKPPGAGHEGAAQAVKATIDVSELSAKDPAANTEQKSEMARENLTNDQLMLEHKSDDLSDYATNVKNNQDGGILAPEIQEDLALMNPSQTKQAPAAPAPDAIVIDSSKTSQSST